MVGAAAAKAALAGLKTEKYVFERTAYPELYHMATPEMAAHNAKRCDSQVSAQLRKAFPSREGRHFWFMGAMHRPEARHRPVPLGQLVLRPQVGFADCRAHRGQETCNHRAVRILHLRARSKSVKKWEKAFQAKILLACGALKRSSA